MNTKKAVVFDLDGTLLNTIGDISQSVNHALKAFAQKEHDEETIKTFVGNGWKRLIELSVEGGTQNPLFEKIYEESKKYYSSHSQIKTCAYDGVVELIKALSERGIKTGIVSNKPHDQVRYLASLYFSEFIPENFAWGENEALGIKRKPSPDCVNALISEMNVKKEEAVYVGDSDVDILTAKNAGLDCISVAWGFKTKEFLEEHGASKIILKPEELLNCL